VGIKLGDLVVVGAVDLGALVQLIRGGIVLVLLGEIVDEGRVVRDLVERLRLGRDGANEGGNNEA
jgi:hypothetical protein